MLLGASLRGLLGSGREDRTVAETLELGDDRGEVGALGVVVDAALAGGEAHLSRLDALGSKQHLLGNPRARGAPHAVEVEEGGVDRAREPGEESVPMLGRLGEDDVEQPLVGGDLVESSAILGVEVHLVAVYDAHDGRWR